MRWRDRQIALCRNVRFPLDFYDVFHVYIAKHYGFQKTRVESTIWGWFTYRIPDVTGYTKPYCRSKR